MRIVKFGFLRLCLQWQFKFILKVDKKTDAKAGSSQRLLTSGEKVILYNLGRDKYFRLLASVKVGGIDVAEYLIKKGLAKSYDGGAKVWWIYIYYK